MRVFFSVLTAAILTTGCATDQFGNKTTSGAAVYNYERTGNDCKMSASTARNPTNIRAQVDSNCAMLIETTIDPKENINPVDVLGVAGALL